MGNQRPQHYGAIAVAFTTPKPQTQQQQKMDAEKVAESQELVQTEVQSWRLSYEHVIAFQEPRSDGMSYMVVLSKPTKKKPIPDPIVRVIAGPPCTAPPQSLRVPGTLHGAH